MVFWSVLDLVFTFFHMLYWGELDLIFTISSLQVIIVMFWIEFDFIVHLCLLLHAGVQFCGRGLPTEGYPGNSSSPTSPTLSRDLLPRCLPTQCHMQVGRDVSSPQCSSLLDCQHT